MIKNVKLCPCHSGLPYEECCKKFHQGMPAETAVQLMRSRYSAYALNKPDYIIQTTHPKNPHYSSNYNDWKQEIQNFSKTFSFDNLIIIHSSNEGSTATVTFTASLSHKGRDASFTERSSFIKEKNCWLYVSGEVNR